MKEYYCPYCNEKLSFLNGTVIKMLGHMKCEKFELYTYFYIPGALGQYDAIIEGNVILKDGAKVDFLCINPRCQRSFTTDYDDDLAEIKMVDDDGHEYLMVFNRIYGKHSTFVIDYKRKELASSFGEHKDIYMQDFDRSVNFFGE